MLIPDSHRNLAEAVVVVAPNHHVDEQALKELIAHRLAKFKVPRIFEFVDALPRNAAGKILRRELKSTRSVANDQ
jgi:acyl-CoA synthetase (AMP-forming)/AMP-acid ligase II